MAGPLPLAIPTSQLIQNLEGQRDDPDLYQTLKALADQANAQANFLQDNFSPGTPPQGPGSVTVTAIDSAYQVTWTGEATSAVPFVYRIYYSDAGTRSAPTTPLFTDATTIWVATMPAQNVSCLPQGSNYTYIDKNITVTQKDPANPGRRSFWITTIVIGPGQTMIESAPISGGAPVEVLVSGAGDQSGGSNQMGSFLNKLANTAFLLVSGTLGSAQVPVVLTISAATNATPIQITTGSVHNLSTNDTVWIGQCTGNTAANGYWTITKVDASNFTLNTSVGNGALVVAGFVVAVKSGNTNQPVPLIDASLVYGWSPWWTNTTNGAKFVDDGANFTQEISLQAGGALGQYVSLKKFRPGMHLTFSAYMKISAADAVNVTMQVFDLFGGGLVTGTINASLLTTTYQRFVFDLALSTTAPASPLFFYVKITNNTSAKLITVVRPMVNVGDAPVTWTGTTDLIDAPLNLTAGTDTTIPAWSRTNSVIYLRDASAPYQ